MIRDILVSAFVLVVFAGVVALTNLYPVALPDEGQTEEIAEYVIRNFREDTGAQNAVAAIYLNYRVYDTLFEALLLLIAIIGIIHFFRIGIGAKRDE